MNRIDKLLPNAMKALEDSGLIYKLCKIEGEKIKEQDCILKEYDGYVASFAPSVITAGLKATLSFYTDKHKFGKNESEMPDYTKNTKSPPRRFHILKVLHNIYESINGHLQGDDLLAIALDTSNESHMPQLKRDLVDCSIALKLVMRNFKQLDKIPSPSKQNAIS